MNMMSRRNYMFDNLKAILIILVVLGHLLDTTNPVSHIFPTIYYFIYFFHMPLFIFISGYFSKNVEKCRETAVQNLFLPYFILNIIMYIQCYIMNWLKGEPTNMFRVFLGMKGLWFLFAMFVWKILLKDLIRIRYVLPLSFVIGAVAGVSNEMGEYLSLGRIMGFSCFFLLGYFITPEHVEKLRSKTHVLPVIIIIAAFAFAAYASYGHRMPIECILFRKAYPNDALLEWIGIRILLYAIALLMIYACLNLMTDKKTRLTKVGENTLTVYILHLFVIRVLDSSYFNIFKNNSYVYAAYLSIFTVLITYLFSRDSVKRVYQKIMNACTKCIFRT
ncbi:MAG: acyltransferase family protein [Agathobacter sp.]